MAAVSATALDLITGAMRNIGVLEAGETPSSQDSSDALQVLNDLLESWSLDHLYVYASVENILTYTAGQYQYSVGNYVAGTFTGTLVAGSATVSGVTVPSNLVVGGTITDVQGSIPDGTTITVIGATTLTMSANALITVAAAETMTYTIPGDFDIPRPLRITNAFSRFFGTNNAGLDYGIEIITRDKYTALGYKGIAGPWPTKLYYDPTFPLGTIFFYPNPTSALQLHLWTDTIFSDFSTLTQAINLPQGYARAIKKNLAVELAPEYGKSPSELLMRQAHESKMMIKSLNAIPTVEAFFDRALVNAARTDAGWVMSGGFT
jgi:hypothetical protein